MNTSIRNIQLTAFIFAFSFLFSIGSQAQNKLIISNLKLKLNTVSSDNQKAELLNKLSFEYMDINDSMLYFALHALQLSKSTSNKNAEIEAYTNIGFYYNSYLRNIETAFHYFDSALVLCQKMDKKFYIRQNLKIVQTFDFDKQVKNTKKYLLQAYHSSQLLKQPTDEYRQTLYLLADVYGRLRMEDSALFFLKLFEKNIEKENKIQEAELNILSAIVYGNYLKRYEEQTNYYQKAELILSNIRLDNSKSSQVHTLYIQLYHSFAVSLWEKGQWEASRLYYQKLIDYYKNKESQIAHPRSFHSKIWSAYTFAIRNLINDGKEPQTEELINDGLAFFEKRGDNYFKAKLLWSIESSYWRFSDYYNAFRFQQEELKEWQQMGNTYWSCICFENIGMIHGRLGNFDKQLSIYYQLLKTASENKISVFTMYAYKDIAKSYYHLNKPDSGLFFIEKAIELNKEIDNSFISMVNYYTKGLLLEINGMNTEAIDALTEAWNIMNKFAYPMNTYDRVAAQSALARIYMKTGELLKAYDLAFLSLAKAKAENVKEVMRDDYYTLAELCKREGNKDLAIEYYESYIQLESELAGEEAKKAIQRAEIENIKKQSEQEKLLLQKDNQLKEIQLNQQKLIIYTIVGGFVLLLVLSVVIFRSYKQKQKDNILLSKQKNQIEDKNEELQLLNEDLHQKNEEIQSQNEEIAKQRDILEKQTQDITDSINYAWKIQQAILPSTDIISDKMSSYFVLYKPRDIVSGDFYWFRQINNLLYIVAADCTGHGVPGAFMSMLGVSALNELVTKRDIQPPAVILNNLRKRIKESLHQTGKYGEAQDGMDISLIMIDFDTKTLQFAGAYNPLYLYRPSNSNSEDFQFETIKANRMPIGIHPKDNQEFTNHELPLQKGDTMYIFSDGYTSQFGGDKGDTLKTKRFQDLLSENVNKPMAEQKQILDTFLAQWQGEYKQIDDILIIGLKYEA